MSQIPVCFQTSTTVTTVRPRHSSRPLRRPRLPRCSAAASVCFYFSTILHPSTCRSAYFSTCRCHMTLVYIALLHLSLHFSVVFSGATIEKVCVDTIEIRPAPKCLCRYNRNPTKADMLAELQSKSKPGRNVRVDTIKTSTFLSASFSAVHCSVCKHPITTFE